MKKLKFIIPLILCMVVAFSCKEDREIDEGCFCPAVYIPVCGVDGKTYGNACEAACAKVEVDFEGEC